VRDEKEERGANESYVDVEPLRNFPIMVGCIQLGENFTGLHSRIIGKYFDEPLKGGRILLDRVLLQAWQSITVAADLSCKLQFRCTSTRQKLLVLWNPNGISLKVLLPVVLSLLCGQFFLAYPRHRLECIDTIIDCSLKIIQVVVRSPTQHNGRNSWFVGTNAEYDDRRVSDLKRMLSKYY